MTIEHKISEATAFSQARNRFIALIGSLPPKEAYYAHPALDAIALAIRYATRKQFRHEGIDQEFRLMHSEGEAVQMLYCITRRGEDFLFLGRSHVEYMVDLEELINQRYQNIIAIVDDERRTYGYCTRDMSDFAHESFDIAFMRVAVMLISPELPPKGNHRHVYIHAWTKLREVPPPEHAWLTHQIAWGELI